MIYLFVVRDPIPQQARRSCAANNSLSNRKQS
jgi:hypothetical protein